MSGAELPESTEPTEVPGPAETPETPAPVVMAEPAQPSTELELLAEIIALQKQQAATLTQIRKHVGWIAFIIIGVAALSLAAALCSGLL